jgi:hypothetical protein
MEEPGSIIELINELLYRRMLQVISDKFSGPCVTTYRVPYSAVESSEEERGQDC